MIYLATLDDVEAIARIHIDAWCEVYRGYVSPDVLGALTIAQRAEVWANAIARNPRNVAVAKTDEAIVGFVSVGRSADPDARTTTGEVLALHVTPRHWKHGFGSALMNWVLATGQRRGWKTINLWVFQENARARAFYEALNWMPDGQKRCDMFGTEPLTEVRYQRDPNA